MKRLLQWICRMAGIETNNQQKLSMSLILTDEQQVTLRIEPKTAAGNPARIDGVPSWTVSSDDVLEIVPAADGMAALVRARGPLGTAQVFAEADADLGEGVRTIGGVLDVEVLAAEAVSLLVVAGAPEVKPEEDSGD